MCVTKLKVTAICENYEKMQTTSLRQLIVFKNKYQIGFSQNYFDLRKKLSYFYPFFNIFLFYLRHEFEKNTNSFFKNVCNK